MPLFEYRCQGCDQVEEILQKYTDAAPAVCPSCGIQGAMHKEVSLSSFQLKGGGWYKDLYSSTPPGKDGGEKGKEAPDVAKASDGPSSDASTKDKSTSSGAAASTSSGAEKKLTLKGSDKKSPERRSFGKNTSKNAA
jgi:putative FmdB family regulatory protein